MILRLLVFCILKLRNRQCKYVKANSQIIPKLNCTGGALTPCTEHMIYECSTEKYIDFRLVIILASSYEPILTTYNNCPMIWCHFSCTLNLSSKTQDVRIFFKLSVYIYIYACFAWNCPSCWLKIKILKVFCIQQICIYLGPHILNINKNICGHALYTFSDHL